MKQFSIHRYSRVFEVLHTVGIVILKSHQLKLTTKLFLTFHIVTMVTA